METRSTLSWYFLGMRKALSLPTVILMGGFVGFASLAREADLSLLQVMLMTIFIWALPSIVVLTGALSTGVGLVTAAIAVALSSIRLMPMTVALMPVLRDGKRTPNWLLLIMSHFVAVTAWVFAMRTLPDMPRHARLPFFAGFVSFVNSSVAIVTAIAYLLVPQVPDIVAGALVMLTPIYFLISMWGAARVPSDHMAMIFGLILGPVFYLWFPGFDLLLSGFVGGTLAYGLFTARRKGWI
ncbi:AzlC family ABC transporter permease [Pseudovibrio exalbescens]|nr:MULTISPECIES: AzlC family ABC transporter permease [Pseudovibrio]MDD7910679.1 AzlC family ABC transporter permease [Pseudovibrio exalbescens]MDX5594482.1 AzlC family ABC transporter permease [Pseudovibrio sp. SPO723]